MPSHNYPYDPSWRNYKPKRFVIVKDVVGGKGFEEVIASYPHFKSVAEGLKYIRRVYGIGFGYGIVDRQAA
jgi:hypothetical protein